MQLFSPIDSKLKKLNTIEWILLAVIMACCITFLSWRNTQIYTNRPVMNRGDGYSELNVLMAGNSFKEQGFLKTCFLPTYRVHDYQEDFFRSYVYTHYPPLTEIINGFLQTLGVSQVHQLRLIPIVLSLAGLILFFIINSIFLGNKFGLISTFILAVSPVFLSGADGLHQHGYHVFIVNLLILSTIVWTIKSYEEIKFSKWFWLAFFCGFFQSLISFEYNLFTVFFFVLVYFCFKNKAPVYCLLILVSAPILGFLLHFFQNAVYLGSVKSAFLDLFGVFLQRTKNIGGDAKYAVPDTYHYLEFLYFLTSYLYNTRLEFLLIISAISLYFIPDRKINKQISLFIGIIGIATPIWFLVFKQLNFIQIGLTYRHWYYFVAILISLIIWTVFKFFSADQVRIGKNYFYFAAWGLCALLILIPYIYSNVMYFKNELQRAAISEKIDSKISFQAWTVYDPTQWRGDINRVFDDRDIRKIDSLPFSPDRTIYKDSHIDIIWWRKAKIQAIKILLEPVATETPEISFSNGEHNINYSHKETIYLKNGARWQVYSFDEFTSQWIRFLFEVKAKNNLRGIYKIEVVGSFL